MRELDRLNKFLAEAERLLAEYIEKVRNNGTENSFASKLLISLWHKHIKKLKRLIE